MKLTVLALAACTCFTISCSTPAEKVEKAEVNVTEANKSLDKANEEYMADIEKYKAETAVKIADNEKTIAEFKLKIAKDKTADRELNDKAIADLRQKDADMKKRMNDYKPTTKDNWQIFKAEFSHDMDELGKAFKDFTVKNVK
ncbi:MAG: hypothetical protein V4450_05610 [Bacteroidota bacterium]